MEQKGGTIWSCTTAIPQQLSFELGLPLLWTLLQLSSFSVAVNTNVNNLLH